MTMKYAPDGSDSTYYYGPKVTKTSIEWAEQYLNIPQKSTMTVVGKLALYYYLRCEHVDRMICKERDQYGDARPAMPWELDGVAHTSRTVLEEILRAYPAVRASDLRMSIWRLGHSQMTTSAIEEMWWRECGSLPKITDTVDAKPPMPSRTPEPTVELQKRIMGKTR